jgi:hypothetical protein
VYIFQPASSGASVKNNVFDKLSEQLTIEDLNQVYNDIQALQIIINVLFRRPRFIFEE